MSGRSRPPRLPLGGRIAQEFPVAFSSRTRLRTLALVGLLATTATMGAAACGTPAGKSISGTIQGADGRYVDVMIGYDVIDSAGRKIDMGNLRQGYSVIQRLNHCVATSGSVGGGVCPGTNKGITKNFSLRLPSNAAKVYIEIYPKAPNPTDWISVPGYTGVATGSTNTSTYGRTFRRAIPVGGAVTNVGIVVPKVCGTPGGTTGTLSGHINNMGAGHITAWSMAPDGTRSMGFSMGEINSAGNYRIDTLQAGQRYGVMASGRRSVNLVDYRRATSNDTLIPAPCFNKVFNF
jgi:hypothetical protein